MKKLFFLMTIAIQVCWANGGDTISAYRFSRTLTSGMGTCDACGCSATGGGMGFGSVYAANFAGVRYFYQQYRSKDGIFDNSPHIRENFNTIQLWGRFPVTKKIQLTVLLPYQFHVREKSDGDEKISGLGDATVLGLVDVWKTHNDSLAWKHKLQLGGGVKLPTGKYDEANNAGSVNPGFQLGTGSWDYLLAIEYVVKNENFGFDAMASYTIKTENDKSYRFGNQLNYGGTFFCLTSIGAVRIVPQAGLAGEQSAANFQHGQEIFDTGGNVLFSRFGIEAGTRQFSVGLLTMLPVAQNLAAGNVEAKYRVGVNLNYDF